MLAKELQERYELAQEKVNKRLNTIDKLCNKLNVDKNLILNDYNSIKNLRDSYFPSKTSQEIISRYLSKKETRDSQGNWIEENYTWNDKVNQLEDNLPKLFDLEKVAYNWKAKWDAQVSKDNAPKIEVLVKFLNNWGTKVKNFIIENIQKQIDISNEYHEFVRNIIIGYNNHENYNNREEVEDDLRNKLFEKYEIKSRYRYPDVYDIRKKFIPDLTRDLSTIKFERENKDDYSYSSWGNDSYKGKYYLEKFDYEKLDRIIEEEKQRKYFDLCDRISAVGGIIQNVNNLSIGNQQGELNGTVKCSKGIVEVNTIGAGGYNIQCFHYRVLVNLIQKI